ncbi:MAG: hypothetical protein E6I45_10730, partial [Chloroflexi bacterium]
MERGRRARCGHDADVGEDGAPGGVPPQPASHGPPDRLGFLHRATLSGSRPAGHRSRLGGHRQRRDSHRRRAPRRHRPGLRSKLGSRPGGGRRPDDAALPATARRQSQPGRGRKGALFEALLAQSDALTGKYVVKVLTGELRIGLREGLLEAAIARAYERPLDQVKTAGMLTGDIGETAILAAADRLSEASPTLFHPLKFMLASPAEDAAEIIGRLGPTVWVEDKYDGIRAQLHRDSSGARLYSRDLHDISGQFPEVVRGAADLPWSGILDGEILAYL